MERRKNIWNIIHVHNGFLHQLCAILRYRLHILHKVPLTYITSHKTKSQNETKNAKKTHSYEAFDCHVLD